MIYGTCTGTLTVKLISKLRGFDSFGPLKKYKIKTDKEQSEHQPRR